jgi:hypothetical protein
MQWHAWGSILESCGREEYLCVSVHVVSGLRDLATRTSPLWLTPPTSLMRHHHLGDTCLPDRRFGSLQMLTSISPCFTKEYFLSWGSRPVFYIQNSRPQVAPTGSHCLEETVETVAEYARPNSVASGEKFPIFASGAWRARYRVLQAEAMELSGTCHCVPPCGGQSSNLLSGH